MKNKLIHRFIIGTFVSLYWMVSVISTIHVVDFFRLSNPYWLAVSLAIAFEVGAAASLASLIVLEKMNKALIWSLFIVITLMQMQGNVYYAFVNMGDFQGWSELFGLIEEDPIYQKRFLSAVSGAILPLVALGFIKSLVDYIKPEQEIKKDIPSNSNKEDVAGTDLSSKIEDVSNSSEEISPEVKVLDGEISDYENHKKSGTEILEESKPLENEIIEVEEKNQEEVEPSNALSDEEADLILSAISENPIKKIHKEQSVPGYYGDINLEGNGIQTEEGQVLPVNSNKKIMGVDNSSKVYLNPTQL